MYDLPGYVWAVTLVGVLGIPALTCLVLYRGAHRAGLGQRSAVLVASGAAAILGSWLVVSSVLANQGMYHSTADQGRPWLAVAAVGMLAVLLASTRIPLVARVLAAPGTTARLALPHAFRIVGAAFLITMAIEDLPPAFALPAGLGDIAIAIAAPFIARGLARGTSHRAAVRFNVLGAADVVLAVGIGVIGYRVFTLTPTTEPMSLLPLGLIPSTAVPLLLALHIVSLRQSAAAARLGHLAEPAVPGHVASRG